MALIKIAGNTLLRVETNRRTQDSPPDGTAGIPAPASGLTEYVYINFKYIVIA